MQLFKFTNEEKKSLVITLVISASVVLILFLIRFTSTTTLAMLSDGGGGGGGVTVNFGDSDFGSGTNFQSEVLEVNEVKKAQAVQETVVEESILTQEKVSSNDYVIPKKEITKPKETKVVTDKPKTPVQQETKKQTVSNETNNALANLLGGNKGGDGDDNKAGNKGKANGSLNSTNYYGSGSGNGTGTGNGSGSGSGMGSGSGSGYGSGSGSGVGSGSGYSLGNRKAISKPLPAYKCNETGKVIVEVSVDKTGKTLSATPGVRGTTNNAKCLLDQAKIAAMNTKWEASDSAPDKQIGQIIYYFTIN